MNADFSASHFNAAKAPFSRSIDALHMLRTTLASQNNPNRNRIARQVRMNSIDYEYEHEHEIK